MKRLTLKQARQKRQWTQEQLEAATAARGNKVDQQNISAIERGAITDPRNSTVETLETALEVARGTLIFGQPTESAA